jgi:hypothetical protein
MGIGRPGRCFWPSPVASAKPIHRRKLKKADLRERKTSLRARQMARRGARKFLGSDFPARHMSQGETKWGWGRREKAEGLRFSLYFLDSFF